MSTSSGTLICMRKASSYCAIRVAISGLWTSASLQPIEPADGVDDVLLLRAIDAGRIADVVDRVALGDGTARLESGWAESRCAIAARKPAAGCACRRGW